MAKNPKMILCRNCNTPIPAKAKVCPSCGAKNRKPFYKRVWFILLVLAVLLVVLMNLAGRKRGERFDWKDMELGSMLPMPNSHTGLVFSNSQDSLSLDVYHTSQREYNDYKKACQELGFTEESDSSESSYSAFNTDGYELSLHYYGEEMSIRLDAPIEMQALTWPNSEIVRLLPQPASLTGKIERETSENFLAYIGETSPEAYSAYVDACSANGFTVDYERLEDVYRADNEAGYHITVQYEGNQVMRIEISAPEEQAAPTVTPVPTETPEPAAASDAASSAPASGIRPEFQQAMDSYEAFIDEYIDFMERYEQSDGSDLTLLADYADYMSRYADMMADFDAWNSEDMTTEESLYYLEVQARVSQKLLEAAA